MAVPRQVWRIVGLDLRLIVDVDNKDRGCNLHERYSRSDKDSDSCVRMIVRRLLGLELSGIGLVGKVW